MRRIAGRLVREDLPRWPVDPWRRHPAIWAVAVYRLGRRADGATGLRRKVLNRLEPWLHLLVRLALTIELPRGATIGPGLLIWHTGPITINHRVVIGRNCTLHQQVTIGARHRDGGVPTLGDDVYIGVGAQILGDVTIGDGAKIAAGALVLCDVPAGHTAVGVPARVLVADPEAPRT